MADIRPFRRERRLKSLDECETPRLQFLSMPKRPTSLFIIIPTGIILGIALGYILIL